jgi:hypothetical protein
MDPVLDRLLSIFAPIITVIVASASTIVSILLSKYIAMMKVKQTIANGEVAVKAIEQLYPNLPGEQKKLLALSFAQTLNADSGIKTPDNVATKINESHVLSLPPAPITEVGSPLPEKKSDSVDVIVPLG